MPAQELGANPPGQCLSSLGTQGVEGSGPLIPSTSGDPNNTEVLGLLARFGARQGVICSWDLAEKFPASLAGAPGSSISLYMKHPSPSAVDAGCWHKPWLGLLARHRAWSRLPHNMAALSCSHCNSGLQR